MSEVATEETPLTPPAEEKVQTNEEFFAPFKPQIVANAYCKTCFGRGYLGINRITEVVKGNKREFPQLQLCHCARLEETVMQKMLYRLTKLEENQDELYVLHSKFVQSWLSGYDQIMKNQHTVDRHTLGYWIGRSIDFVKSQFKRFKHNGDEQGARAQLKEQK